MVLVFLEDNLFPSIKYLWMLLQWLDNEEGRYYSAVKIYTSAMFESGKRVVQIAAGTQLVTKSMCGLIMVLVGYASNDNILRFG